MRPPARYLAAGRRHTPPRPVARRGGARWRVGCPLGEAGDPAAPARDRVVVGSGAVRILGDPLRDRRPAVDRSAGGNAALGGGVVRQRDGRCRALGRIQATPTVVLAPSYIRACQTRALSARARCFWPDVRSSQDSHHLRCWRLTGEWRDDQPGQPADRANSPMRFATLLLEEIGQQGVGKGLASHRSDGARGVEEQEPGEVLGQAGSGGPDAPHKVTMNRMCLRP